MSKKWGVQKIIRKQKLGTKSQRNRHGIWKWWAREISMNFVYQIHFIENISCISQIGEHSRGCSHRSHCPNLEGVVVWYYSSWGRGRGSLDVQMIEWLAQMRVAFQDDQRIWVVEFGPLFRICRSGRGHELEKIQKYRIPQLPKCSVPHIPAITINIMWYNLPGRYDRECDILPLLCE